MKKILTIFAFAALLAGCKDLYGPTPQQKDPISGKSVTVTVNPASVGDTGFTAEVAPVEKNVFCSYVLCKEDQPSKLDPDAVLKCTVAPVKCALKATAFNAAGDTVSCNALENAKGTFNADKIVLEFGNLEQNTTYQLYAVAASATGLPGEVVNASVLTTDGRIPAQTVAGTFDTDTTVTVVFSQPVSFVKGSKVEVSIFAEFSAQFQQAKSIGSYDLADDDVIVGEDGKTVEINYHPAKLPAGAYFTVNYPDGAFLSDTNVPCKGCSAAFTYDEKGEEVITVDGEGKALKVYNGGHVETTTFDFTVPEETEVFDPVPTEWVFTQNDEIASIAICSTDLTVEYSYGDDSKSVTHNLAYGSGWNYNMDDKKGVTGITVTLPELPDYPGVDIAVNVPEGIFTDAYGNTSDSAVWSAKFMQLDEIGTGLFSESAFLGISNKEATLFYNPSTDVYRIADCFASGYNLEFKWDQETNKCEIIGMQNTGIEYASGVEIYVEDAYTFYGGQYSWEFLEANGYKQPYYENGVFVFPNVAYELPATGQYVKPQITITYNMGRDITKVQLEGIWSCASVTDYFGDSYGPFNVTIQQAVDKDGSPVENVYAIAGLAPYIASQGIPVNTFGTFIPDENLLVIDYNASTGVGVGGTPIVYKGFDNIDPDVAEYYDNVYFSVNAMSATIINLNSYGLFAGNSPYEMYYGGTMQLKRTADLPVTTSNCVETRAAQSVTLSSKTADVKVLRSGEGSFLKKGKAAFLQPASKVRRLK